MGITKETFNELENPDQHDRNQAGAGRRQHGGRARLSIAGPDGPGHSRMAGNGRGGSARGPSAAQLEVDRRHDAALFRRTAGAGAHQLRVKCGALHHDDGDDLFGNDDVGSGAALDWPIAGPHAVDESGSQSVDRRAGVGGGLAPGDALELGDCRRPPARHCPAARQAGYATERPGDAVRGGICDAIRNDSRAAVRGDQPCGRLLDVY